MTPQPGSTRRRFWIGYRVDQEYLAEMKQTREVTARALENYDKTKRAESLYPIQAAEREILIARGRTVSNE